MRIVPFLLRIHRSEVILQSIYETKLRLDRLKPQARDACKPEEPGKQFQQVYTINSRRVAQSLDLFVGNERINSTSMVDELMKYKRNSQPDEPGVAVAAAGVPEPTAAQAHTQALNKT